MTEKPEKQTVIYRFGQFEINAGEGFLLREGEIVPLTPKIFEMLLLLVKNNGRIISKDEIMEIIWADSFVEETNLTSNISRLRKILHADDEQFIETFPKRGYRFRGDVETIDAEVVLSRRVTTRVRQIIEEFDDAEEPSEYAHALETLPNNLTLPTTAIVGREKEIGEIENLILRNRLVTLTGIGGTGKTRLAQEIACRLLSEFADGVFFIPFAAVRNAELVRSELAKTLGVKESGNKNLSAALKDFLREKNMLLVIDNFEQIIAATPVLAELLAAPNLKLLVTSRSVLHLKTEREFIVPPLALPDLSEPPEVSGGLNLIILSENESIKLFAERAQAIKSNFSLTEGNATTIAEICLKLEGLPLAIELAAARIKILSPAQILERLENRLKTLTGGAKDLPTRQQTMRGAIEWSYDLLDENERVVFERLAVFAGGFTIEAAEAVVEGEKRRRGEEEKGRRGDKSFSPHLPISPSPHLPFSLSVLDGITALVENSLLVQTETGGGASRFRLLEIVREYALEMLEMSGETEKIRENHTEYFLILSEKAEPEILGTQGGKWLDLLEEEHENIRAAIDWADENDAGIFLKIVAATRDFWVIRNHLTEGRKRLEAAFEKSGGASGDTIYKISVGLGQTARFQGDFDTAHKAFKKASEVSRKMNNLKQIAVSIRGLAMTAKGRGDLRAARKFAEESLKLSRETGDKIGIAISVNTLGDVARIKNDFPAARPFYEEALEICTELENKQGVNCTLNNLGAVAYGEKDYKTARNYYTKALNVGRDSGEKLTLSYSLDGFAALAVQSKDFICAAQLAGAADNLRELNGFETEPAEQHFRDSYLTELRPAMTAENFTMFYAQGCQMKIEKAVELALGDGF